PAHSEPAIRAHPAPHPPRPAPDGRRFHASTVAGAGGFLPFNPKLFSDGANAARGDVNNSLAGCALAHHRQSLKAGPVGSPGRWWAFSSSWWAALPLLSWLPVWL